MWRYRCGDNGNDVILDASLFLAFFLFRRLCCRDIGVDLVFNISLLSFPPFRAIRSSRHVVVDVDHSPRLRIIGILSSASPVGAGGPRLSPTIGLPLPVARFSSVPSSLIVVISVVSLVVARTLFRLEISVFLFHFPGKIDLAFILGA